MPSPPLIGFQVPATSNLQPPPLFATASATFQLASGWYRKRFRVPQNLAEAEALYFLFQAVDEEAEIWLNGRKVFEHTRAATGLSPEELWTKPFSFKAGGALDRSGDNVLAVRVYNRAGMGGIWKPVHLVNNKDALTTSTLTMAIQHANPAD